MRRFIAWTFIRKEWGEFRRPIALITGGLLLPVSLVLAGQIRPDLARALIYGMVMTGPFFYAHLCFLAERQTGTLEFLMALPMTRFQLVLAKYASLFSMILFSVNVPGFLLGDFPLLLRMNADALLLAAVFMASTVVSEKSWAPQVPLWMVVVLTISGGKLLQRFDGHNTAIALAELGLVPIIVVASGRLFRG